MRIVILAIDTLACASILSPLLANHSKDVKAIVLSEKRLHSHSPLSAAIKVARRSGFMYITYIILEGEIFKQYIRLLNFLWIEKRGKNTVRQLAALYNIPTYAISNVNSKKNVKLISSLRPDIIISYFSQLLKRDVLSIPAQGCVNVHGSLLPKYRGICIPFWVLYNNEKRAGVTAHYMDETFDTGKIIAQKSFAIEKGDTVYAVSNKIRKLSGKMLLDFVEKVKSKKVIHTREQGRKGARYYSFPTKAQVSEFLSSGKKFITLDEIIQFFRA